ncbi:MAG: bacteriohopanetetrol glucosamine biosynthesis glycosyltransferase HpnI [Chloroflexi bacterium]|nr:bacteriohopanetetrol glucosamine biosynthesis glycosyltransferase HpnI [Chloroflexota bacterium]
MVLTVILGSLALISLALTFWQWLAAKRFPLHQRISDLTHTPPVTMLKPLKGCDAETVQCLRSWLEQEYPGAVQVLFGVASAADPVCSLVRELIEAHPQVDAQLVLCEETLGANAKVSTLVQLQRQAKHEIIVISDADVRIPPDLLVNVIAPLRDPDVGLVNCFYRLANPSTPAMRWEAVAINADFWSQVLQSQSLKPLDFALGAAMATNRSRLEKAGGLSALVDYLADDYQLGNRIAQQGGRIVLCPVVVECWSSPMSWREVWSHQLRWARTIRVCQPLPFFFSILSNATLWPLLWLLAHPTTPALSIAALCWLVRIVTASDHQARLTGAPPRLAHVGMVLLKDLLHAVLWALAFLGNRIEWRGEAYEVRTRGRLVKLD